MYFFSSLAVDENANGDNKIPRRREKKPGIGTATAAGDEELLGNLMFLF